MALERDGRGVLKLKLHTLLQVTFIAVPSLQSKSFEKTPLHFQIILFFQTTDFFQHYFKVSIHMHSFVTSVKGHVRT